MDLDNEKMGEGKEGEPFYFCSQCNKVVTEIIEVSQNETVRMWDGSCYEWHTPLSSEVISIMCGECLCVLEEGY